ncbi:MAG: uroporphyrinogen-III synthase [Pseudomonadales bacterium]|nr:uroporphyrinogen-III synthase [Pseudomonadales bacterium]
MKKLLLTREHEQNQRLIGLLDPQLRQQLEIAELPLLEIVPLPVTAGMRQLVQDLDLFDHVIFISPNASRLGMLLLESFWPQWPIALRWYAVGRATAAELAPYGINVLLPREERTEGLLQLPSLQSPAGDKVLIVKGVGGRTHLAETLQARGAQISYLELYERRGLSYPAEVLMSSPPDLVVVMSGEALQTLIPALQYLRVHTRTADGKPCLPDLLVPSTRLETMALAAGFDKVFVTEPGAEEIAKCIGDRITATGTSP